MLPIARSRCMTHKIAVWVVIAAILRRIDGAHSHEPGDLPQPLFPRGATRVTNPAVFLPTTTTTTTTSWRGGATVQQREDDEDDDDEATIHHIDHDDDAYTRLAHAVQSRLSSLIANNNNNNNENYDITSIVQAFQSLSSSQQAFKGLDGAAHEAYQRTHGGRAKNDNVLLSVQGRARRSAARASAVANALGACELCELLLVPRLLHPPNHNNQLVEERWNQTLTGRQVLLNVTGATQLIPKDSSTNVSVLVLYEPLYQGGAGIHHGSIQDMATTTTTHDNSASPSHSRRPAAASRPRGRLLIVIGDQASESAALDETLIRILEPTPKHVRLHPGPEVASVQPRLYQAAGAILTTIEPVLRSHNPVCVIHFVGRSLSGGIASLAATILDGDIPMPVEKKKRRPTSQQQPQQKQKQQQPSKTVKDAGASIQNDDDNNSNTTTVSSSNSSNATPSIIATAPLQGLGRDRTSALTLGAPPCLSANVPADFVTSILYGDDVVCRITPDSWQRFLDRTQRALMSRSGGWGILGSTRARMADTWTLAASNLQSHAVGSQGEEARLALTGRAYLIRPRRLGGLCSMHEVGASQLKGGREALRAAVLWQIKDVVLSRSLWKHHQLESYIQGLDRVQLRGLEEHDSSNDEL